MRSTEPTYYRVKVVEFSGESQEVRVGKEFTIREYREIPLRSSEGTPGFKVLEVVEHPEWDADDGDADYREDEVRIRFQELVASLDFVCVRARRIR